MANLTGTRTTNVITKTKTKSWPARAIVKDLI